jgi:hypothetical protein
MTSVLLAVVAGCEQRAPLVYVLEAPQAITLTPSASPERARHGETVTLSVKRRTEGKWKQIPRDELRQGQCWVYRPPAQAEEEAAASVEWDVEPETALWFNTEYRMDQTRTATLRGKGTVKLTPLSGVKCEPDRVVEGPTIVLEVL